MGWDTQFDEPIRRPKGKPLATLRDAALYITKLPKAEHDATEWQAAMEALLLVAEHDGPTMFARIGVMRAFDAEQTSRALAFEGCAENSSARPHPSPLRPIHLVLAHHGALLRAHIRQLLHPISAN